MLCVRAGYNIYYTTDKNLNDNEWFQETFSDGKNVAVYIKYILPETTYFFKVEAVNRDGSSFMSDVIEYTHPKGI